VRSAWLEDVRTVMERDPAVKSTWEAIWCYPGVQALWLHRAAHLLYRRRLYFLARLVATGSRMATGIDIHPGAQIGRRVFIDHGMGVVIGETAVVGDDVSMYQGVTLGGTGKDAGKRHPTVGDRVLLAAGAIVLGNISIGDDAKIGAGTVVVRSVPAGATVVGAPGRVVSMWGQALEREDAQARVMELERRVGELEARLGALEEKREGKRRGSTHRLA